VKEELDAAPMGLERMQRDGDLSRADHPIADHRMLDEEVTDNDIAAIVSRWTGSPVDKMLAGEREKLLRMERMISDRVIGQEEAVIAVSNAVRRAGQGFRIRTGR
jgi:ATP-dependent Clp protease ATP-binding subunit ClpB